MPQDEQVVLVISNAPDLLLAKRIAHELVEQGLAACVNLAAPMLSIYGWNGKIEADTEVPLWIKTTTARQQAVLDLLASLHPYEVPEAIVLPVSAGLPAYLQWVVAQTQAPLPAEEPEP